MKQYNKNLALFSFAFLLTNCVPAQNELQVYQPVKFSHVQINDQFWKPKIDRVATVTIPVCVDQTEVKTPRIRNFEIAAHFRLAMTGDDLISVLSLTDYHIWRKRAKVVLSILLAICFFSLQ